MARRKRRPARESNKDERGATTGRPGTARDDSQRAGHADHGEPPAVPGTAPPAVPGTAPPASPVAAEQGAAGRQPQRPGQDARFQEKPGVRDDEKLASAPSERVSPPSPTPPSVSSITKKR